MVDNNLIDLIKELKELELNDQKTLKLSSTKENIKIHQPIKALKLSERANKFIIRFRESNHITKNGQKFMAGPVDLKDHILLSMHDKSRNQELTGDMMLNDIIDVMNNYYEGDAPFLLRVDQQMMVAHILCAFLPFLYKENLEANKKRLLAMLKVPAIKELLVIIASRRVGKTTCIAAVVAAVMIVVPRSVGAIFSLAQRASKRVMQMIISFLNMHPKGVALLTKKDVVKNIEELRLKGDNETEIKVLFAYPDSGDVCLFFFILFLNFQIFF